MNTRKIITVVLLVLTLALGSAAIYFGYRLSQQSEAPENTSAAECPVAGCGKCPSPDNSCNQCCDGGFKAGTCSSDEDWTKGWNACNGISNDSCAASSISSAKDSFTLNTNCTSATIKKFRRNYTGASVAYYPNCLTSDSNGTLFGQENATAGGTYTASYAPGICEQIDAYNGSTHIAGICRCNPPLKSCNQACTSSSQCETGLGCYSGMCRKAACQAETDCVCPTTPPTEATCGDGEINQTSEQCEIGTDCASGNQVCNIETCTCEAVPTECGSTCEADTDCPDITFCNGVTKTDSRYPDRMCILSFCAETGNTCESTGCEVIPENPPEELPSTAIIDKEHTWLVVGLASILSGIVGIALIKFHVFSSVKNFVESTVNNLQRGKFAYLTSPVSSKAQKAVTDKKKNKFEDKMSK